MEKWTNSGVYWHHPLRSCFTSTGFSTVYITCNLLQNKTSFWHSNLQINISLQCLEWCFPQAGAIKFSSKLFSGGLLNHSGILAHRLGGTRMRNSATQQQFDGPMDRENALGIVTVISQEPVSFKEQLTIEERGWYLISSFKYFHLLFLQSLNV